MQATHTFTCELNRRALRPNGRPVQTWTATDADVVIYIDGFGRWTREVDGARDFFRTAAEAFAGQVARRAPEPSPYRYASLEDKCLATGRTVAL